MKVAEESQAPHLPPSRLAEVTEEQLANWASLGGEELEDALQSGAVALLDARYLI